MGKKNRSKKKKEFNDGNISDNPFGGLAELVLPDATADILDELEHEDKFKLQAQPIQIETLRFRIEKNGRKGKTVTLLEGCAEWPEDARKKLLKFLKNQLGTGATYDAPNMVIQGDQRDRLPELLPRFK